jgi:hypothetical protein
MTFLLLLGAGAGSGDGGDSGALQPAASGSSPTGGEGLSNSPYTPTIAIDIHEPLAAGGELINSSIIINSYSHTINAVGGFDTATFTMAANMNMINEWLVSGPMRHIIVKESAGSTIWEGFVDSLDLNFGRVSIKRGPIIDAANKVACKYTTVRYDPLGINFGGKPAITPFVQDTDMQQIYGIIEGIVSGGEMHEDEALEIANTYLAEYKYPETTHNVTFLTGNDPSITVQAKGYGHLLDKYTYAKIDTAADINLSLKIQRAVEGDPNSYFTIDANNFVTNTIQVNEYEDGEKTARGLIDDLVARGDDADNRYIWGVYADRLFQYVKAPVVNDFAFNMSEAQGLLLDQYGERIPPWLVLPGHWITVSDLSQGGHTYNAQDPRATESSIFIEKVSFTAPYDINISGGKVSTLRQKLYRLGLGGGIY